MSGPYSRDDAPRTASMDRECSTVTVSRSLAAGRRLRHGEPGGISVVPTNAGVRFSVCRSGDQS